MKEYNLGLGENVNLDDLVSPLMKKDDYVYSHKSLVILCHDVLLEHNGGILLVTRKDHPAKGLLWPVGGRVARGMATEDSMRRKIKEECGLDVEDLKFVGVCRTFFKTDPFGHRKGTDTFNVMYFGRGKGKLALNELHEQPTIVKPRDYTKEFRNSLHPYIRDFMDLVMPYLAKK